MRTNTITPEQRTAAYELGVRKHRREVTITQALRELSATGLKRSTAADLVYNTTHLINGRRFTRRLSAPVIDHFLTWILQDFKTEGLSAAVSALEKHIHYYEKLRNIRLHADRKLLKKYRLLLGQSATDPTPATFRIEWLDRSARGWIDLLPLNWFDHDGATRNLTHEVQRLDGKQSARARCDVSISGTVAELNYESHEKFNLAEGMDLGVARLIFSDADRTVLQALQWRPLGKIDFATFPYRFSDIQVPDEEEYQLPADKATRKSMMVRERSGQAAFRKKLKGAYGHTCCMTDCEVPDALEGAHIDPFISKASDNLQNGLLLRRDVHVLYDRHLIAIDPATNEVHVAASIRTTNGYGFLQGKKVRSPDNKTHEPSLPALRRRWERFKVATK